MMRRPGRGRGRVSAGLPAFTPASLPGLAAWYRADLGVTYDAGTLKVSQWNDQSGTGDANKNQKQATSGNQPTITLVDSAYNNQATIAFAAASGQFLQSLTWAAALAQPFTLVLVGNDDGTTAGWWLDNNASPETELFNNSGSRYDFYAGVTLNTNVAAGTARRIWIIEGNGASSAVYMNAKTATASGNIGAQGLAGMTLGAAFNGAATMNGKLAEVIVYSGAKRADELASIFAYLGARYAISVGA